MSVNEEMCNTFLVTKLKLKSITMLKRVLLLTCLLLLILPILLLSIPPSPSFFGKGTELISEELPPSTKKEVHENIKLAILEQKMMDLEGSLKNTQDKLQEFESQTKILQKVIGRLEDGIFSDGSAPMAALIDNIYFGSKRWVKLCDWSNCQFASAQENVKYLLKQVLGGKEVVSSGSSKSGIRAIQIVHSCIENDLVFRSSLQKVFVTTFMIVLSGGSNINCSMPMISEAKALEQIADKTLDIIFFQGNEREDEKPVLRNLLTQWALKLKVGGIAIGKDYVVNNPYLMKWKKQSPVATPHQLATKQSVDLYRTGDDNDIGQDDIVNVAGGSIWYFTKKKASFFGTG